MIFISDTKENYTKIDLKLKKEESLDRPLYIETNDSCSKWIPALFAPILIINKGIDGRYKNENYEITNFQSKVTKIVTGISYEMEILSGQVSIFDEIYLARTEKLWPQECQFGLGYSDVIPEISTIKKNFNALKGLIDSKKIEKNIFSFEKWDINISDGFISSKLYIGDSHEDFLEDNVGNCTIQNETGDFGCIFNDFIFLNDTYSLINEEKNKPYIIYFSSEFNKIYFPNSFENKIKKCHFESIPEKRLICPDLENKDYLPLKLRSDNMNITLEVDNMERFHNFYKKYGNITNIEFKDLDYIIFPLTMLKNFHVQFDVENNLIQFYTNDTSLLEVPKKEEPDTTSNPETDPEPDPEPDESQNNNKETGGISTGLLVFLIILGILLIGGLAYGGFLIYKRNHSQDIEKRFNKYSKFEDEDINENKVVY